MEHLTAAGGREGLQSGSVKSNCCGKLREKCRKIAVGQPNLPKLQGATPLQRGHTGHQGQQAGKVDKQKAIAEKLPEIAGKCEQWRKIPKLRKAAKNCGPQIATPTPTPCCSRTQPH